MKATLLALLTLGSLAMAETENILDKALLKLVVDDNTPTVIDLSNLEKSGSFTLTMQLSEAGLIKFGTYVGNTVAEAGKPSLVSLHGTGNDHYVGTGFGYSSDAGYVTDGGIFLTAAPSGPTIDAAKWQNASNYLADMMDYTLFGENVTLTIVHTDKTGTALNGILFYKPPFITEEASEEASITQNAGGLKWQAGLGQWNDLGINTELVSKVALYEGVLTSDQIAASNHAILTMQNVPEPTTGTLSLLALAGLCIRRRK